MPRFYSPRLKREVIPKKLGKIREPASANKYIKLGHSEIPVWHNVIGSKKRFYENYLYSDLIARFPSKKSKPKILVIGAGIGEELIELKNHLNAKKIKPKIETLGITKILTDKASKVVSKDHSMNLCLEEIDIKNPEHKKLIKSLRENFDVVAAPISAGVHTPHIAYNCFLCALMLKPEGVAKIHVLSEKMIKSYLDNSNHYINERSFDFSEPELKDAKSQLRFIQKNYIQTQRLIPSIYRMLESYLGKEVARKYIIEIKPDKFNPNYNILEIKRNR